MPRPLCIYHKNCLDGNGSAAVVARKVPDCEFLAMQYSMTPPQVLDRVLYMVDFGLPIAHMRALKAQSSEFIWIDHHASQLPICKTLGWGVMDTTECGTSLTWKTLFPGQEPPPVIAYIKDKDLWQWKLPDSRAVSEGLTATFPGERFAGILEADIAAMATLGRPLLAAKMERVLKAAKTGLSVEAPYGMVGARALAVNTNQDQNELGDHICTPVAAGGMGYDLAVLYYRKGTARWVHSLRSAEGGRVDCGTIAERRGGGGHPNSACYLDPVCFTASPDCPGAGVTAAGAPAAIGASPPGPRAAGPQ
ncbi:MAG: hypothetical protein H0X38_06195 [Planctomycetes bacterium]|nr:hypothetical protein [Planctomycetota bacterium]